MGLIDLKTDLKSLKYGNDKRGGGSSNQPYITTPIPDGFAPTSPDFLLRNGYLNPVSSLRDVSRLTKWFTDTKSANGILFTAKQQLLERQNVKVPGGFNRIYNPAGTIAQAGVLSIGYHLNKQGLNPFVTGYFNGGREGYYYPTIAGSNVDGGVNGGENRLALLYTSKIADQSLGTFDINPFGITGPQDQVNLLSYSGGPNSIGGFGKTNIRIQNPTRTVVSRDKATVAFKSTIVDNIGYLTPTGGITINWSYNPTGENNLSNNYIINVGENNNIIYTDNVLGLLNRDTSTVIPIGKPANTFDKNNGLLKTSPDYLRTGPIKPGTVSWVYRPISGPTGKFNLFQELQIRAGTVPDRFSEEDSIQLSKLILNRTGLEGEDAPDNIYPSSSIITRSSYYKTKDTNTLISSNLKSFNTASTSAGFNGDSENDILTNLGESSPMIYKVDDDIVEGKRKTTTLSSLNPQYFELNSTTKEITSISAFDDTLIDFNREKTYKTLTTSYNSSAALRGNANRSISSDGVNLSRILSITSSGGNNENEIDDLKQSDLIKFFFEINNNSGGTNTQNWFLFFRAYLNDLGDNFKADWQPYKYVGRAENFYKYSGFSRDISLSFTVYAHSRAEMAPIYEKLNYLIGTTAPDYSGEGYMRGNFIYLTVGDYLDNVPGIIQSIDLKPSFDAGWDIDRDVLTGNVLQQSYLQLPKMIEINMSFTPIHSFTPQFGEAFIRNRVQPPRPTISTQQPT